ncbi:hypothetical protein AAHA92_24774 [Salvia divinorum]|uniref:Uncharacterized protein n=1 Tax=Salvia divinorum TaxID=28513 RepID=A0ABD1G8G6_SALDI
MGDDGLCCCDLSQKVLLKLEETGFSKIRTKSSLPLFLLRYDVVARPSTLLTDGVALTFLAMISSRRLQRRRAWRQIAAMVAAEQQQQERATVLLIGGDSADTSRRGVKRDTWNGSNVAVRLSLSRDRAVVPRYSSPLFGGNLILSSHNMEVVRWIRLGLRQWSEIGDAAVREV